MTVTRGVTSDPRPAVALVVGRFAVFYVGYGPAGETLCRIQDEVGAFTELPLTDFIRFCGEIYFTRDALEFLTEGKVEQFLRRYR